MDGNPLIQMMEMMKMADDAGQEIPREMMMMMMAAMSGQDPSEMAQKMAAKQLGVVGGTADCTLKYALSFEGMIEQFDPTKPNHLYTLWLKNYDEEILPDHEQFPCSFRLSVHRFAINCDDHFRQCGHAYSMLHRDGRTRLGKEIAWCIPTPEVLTYIVENSPNGIVEIGGGRGYIARELERVGGKVSSYDLYLPTEGHKFFDVKNGGPRTILAHPKCALLLCYPPQKGHVGAGMAATCVKIFRATGGTDIFFLGERGGETKKEIGSVATTAFWQALSKHGYTLKKELSLAQFPHGYSVMCHYKLE
jgi:hypothetical protein